MFSLNRAQIIGNLTRDPEMRYIPSGQAVCSFSVATNRRWRDKDGNNQDETQFHDVVAWGKLAEIVAQILHKGNKVYVEGRLQTRQWEGQDGAKRNKTEIVAENFVALTPKGDYTPSAPAEIGADVEEFPPSAEATGGKPDNKKKKDDLSSEALAKDDDEINLDEIPF